MDYVLHPVLTDPTDAVIAEIPELAAEGHTSLKIFMVMEQFDTRVDKYLQAMQAAARCGVLTLVHCEDGAIIRHACRELLARDMGAARYYPESRPVSSEVAAVERAVACCRVTGAPIYIVHLSSAEALERCRRARAAGLPVYVETRPMCLHLTRELFEQPDAAKYAGAPPLRDAADVEALWEGMRGGDIQCVCSDHAPWTLGQKLDPSLDVSTLRQGVADLETLMPMLFSEGVRTGRGMGSRSASDHRRSDHAVKGRVLGLRRVGGRRLACLHPQSRGGRLRPGNHHRASGPGTVDPARLDGHALAVEAIGQSGARRGCAHRSR